MPKVTFEFHCGYLGETDFNVYGAPGIGRVSFRHEASDYEQSIFNGNATKYRRDCVQAVNVLRVCNCLDAAPQWLVTAFNDWRAARHADWLETWKANPDKYGEFDPSDRLAQPPAPAHAARYDVDLGWVRV